jgi:hypothetical protein
MSAKVVSLPTSTLPQSTDIPTCLRHLADRLEESPTDGMSCVVLMGTTENFDIAAYGVRTSPLEVKGWLTHASMMVCFHGPQLFDGTPEREPA